MVAWFTDSHKDMMDILTRQHNKGMLMVARFTDSHKDMMAVMDILTRQHNKGMLMVTWFTDSHKDLMAMMDILTRQHNKGMLMVARFTDSHKDLMAVMLIMSDGLHDVDVTLVWCSNIRTFLLLTLHLHECVSLHLFLFLITFFNFLSSYSLAHSSNALFSPTMLLHRIKSI